MKPATPEICIGRMMHKRLKPVPHHISYGVFFVRVPLSALSSVDNRWFGFERFNLLSLHVRDYGPRDGTDPARWVRETIESQGVPFPGGEIVLQTFPRMLGFVFNPVSFWLCHDREGALRVVLAEVNNTFGERHNYVVTHMDGRPIQADDMIPARKVFHVSPFCEVKGQYRFRFIDTDDRALAQIDFHDSERDDDKVIAAHIQGKPEPLTSRSALRAFMTHPLMTLMVVWRIHWHALKLWLKRVPFFHKPAPPLVETTRSVQDSP